MTRTRVFHTAATIALLTVGALLGIVSPLGAQKHAANIGFQPIVNAALMAGPINPENVPLHVEQVAICSIGAKNGFTAVIAVNDNPGSKLAIDYFVETPGVQATLKAHTFAAVGYFDQGKFAKIIYNGVTVSTGWSKAAAQECGNFN
jgi:hypothetical protein